MQGLFGLIKQELHKQDKLPMKYYDVPSEPVKSGCTFYVDGINNNGGSHSNTTTSWIPIIGSVKGTKVGSVGWGDKCMIQTVPAKGGYYFGRVGKYAAATVEVVFKTDGWARVFSNQESSGFSLYVSVLSSGPLNPVFNTYNTNISGYTAIRSETIFSRSEDRIVYMCGRFSSDSIQIFDSKSKRNYTQSVKIAPLAGTVPFAIGYNPTTGGSPEYPTHDANFNGTLSVYAVRIYNRLLTDAEVEANMIYDKNRYGF